MIPFEIPENFQYYLNYAPLFGLAVIIAFLVTPVVGYIARRFNILGYPPSMRDGNKTSDSRHLEKQPTPLLGGVAVIIPFIILILANTSPSPEVTALIIAIVILLIMGIIDDMHDLSGGIQLFIQFLVALFLVVSVIDIPYVTNPLGGLIHLDQFSYAGTLWGLKYSILFPGDILLLAWILICTISVKVTSGSDGLMEGNSMIATFLFFLLSVRFLNSEIAIASIIFTGLIFGFLFYNFYPAKIRSGSSGKSTYGFILAVLSVLSGAKLATVILILLLPIVDFFFVVINRYRDHKPGNPLRILSISDKTHLHHKLLELGFSERRVAFTEYFITAILGLIALAISGTTLAFFFFLAVVIIAGSISLLSFFIRRKSEAPPPPDPEGTPEARYSY